MRKFLSGILSLLLLMGLLPAAYAEEPALGVTYEIFVASFQDSGGDGIGDLQGIIDRLDIAVAGRSADLAHAYPPLPQLSQVRCAGLLRC